MGRRERVKKRIIRTWKVDKGKRNRDRKSGKVGRKEMKGEKYR